MKKSLCNLLTVYAMTLLKVVWKQDACFHFR